jgi:hypothetical protein
MLRAAGCENQLGLALAVRGRARRRLGDEPAACGDLEESLKIFERLGTCEEPARLRRELASTRT